MFRIRPLDSVHAEACRDKLTGSGPCPTPGEFGEADLGGHHKRENAQKEFEEYALATWQSLVCMEKSLVAGTPCTAVFCRLDIGVIMKNRTISYFVNEVEHSLMTSL